MARPKRVKKDILGSLTPPTELNIETAKITGKPHKQEQKQVGRPKSIDKQHRKKLTTMADPAIIAEIKILAIRRGISTADLLEKLMLNEIAKDRKSNT